jgi:hypothetical protein
MNKYAIIDENNKVINIIISSIQYTDNSIILLQEDHEANIGSYYSSENNTFYKNPLNISSNSSEISEIHDFHNAFFTGSLNSIEINVNSKRPLSNFTTSSLSFDKENVLEISSLTSSGSNSFLITLITGSNFHSTELFLISTPITESLGYVWEFPTAKIKVKE